MSNQNSLERIYQGFISLSQKDKSAYLEYFKLLIQRNPDDKSLRRFKRKVENETKVLSSSTL